MRDIPLPGTETIPFLGGSVIMAMITGSAGLATMGRLELTNASDPSNRVVQSITQGSDADFARPDVANRLVATPAVIARIRQDIASAGIDWSTYNSGSLYIRGLGTAPMNAAGRVF